MWPLKLSSQTQAAGKHRLCSFSVLTPYSFFSLNVSLVAGVELAADAATALVRAFSSSARADTFSLCTRQSSLFRERPRNIIDRMRGNNVKVYSKRSLHWCLLFLLCCNSCAVRPIP